MPCNTIQTNTVKLETALKNEALLEKGLASEFGSYSKSSAGRYSFHVDGATVYMDGPAFRSTLSASRLGAVVGRVQQAYSREAVKMAVKRFGWVTEKSADPNVFTITHN